MQGIRRESFLTNPPRQVSTTFVRFQWGNGSHCHECLNKPTLPRRSYGLFCLNEFSDKQVRTTKLTKPNSKFFSVKGTETTSIFHSSPANAENPRLQETDLYSARSRVIELASGMRQLAGTRTRYRRAHAAPLAGLISGRAKYNSAT